MDLSNGYALSLQQKRWWLLGKETGRRCPNILLVDITGPLTVEALKEAARHVAEKHEIFRVRLQEDAGMKQPLQVIGEQPAYVFTICPPGIVAGREGRIKELCRQLEAPVCPALCFTLFEEAPGKACLGISALSLYADKHSLNIILEDLAAAYRDIAGGNPPSLNEDALQYIDYSEWQQEMWNAPSKEGVQYWKQVWKEERSRYALPFESDPGSDWAPEKIARYDIQPEHILREKLEQATGRYGVSPAAVLLCCWYLLIKRYKADATVAYCAAMRENEGTGDITGAFEKVLPFELKISDSDLLTAAVAAVENHSEIIASHGEYLELAANCTLPYAFEETRAPGIQEAGPVSFEVQDYFTFADIFKLKLAYTSRNGQPANISLYYDQRLYSASVIANMAISFKALLHTLLDNMEAGTVSCARIAGYDEKELLLRQVVPIGAAVGNAAHTLVSLFEKAAKLYAGRKAIVYGKYRLSYEELNHKANQVAVFLQKHYQLQAGDRVAVKLKRSEKLLPWLLGILKCGASYLPVDIAMPGKRLEFILKDSGAKLLLADNPPALNATVPVFLLQEKNLRLVEKERATAQLQTVTPDTIAYVIYTSGTTGNPKGVMVPHASLVNYLTWFCKGYNINSEDSTLLFSSIAFDLCYTSLWSSLVSGATLHLLEEQEYLDAAEMIKTLIAAKITYIKLTPSHFKLLLSDPAFPASVLKYKLRLVVLGGEAIVPADIKKVLQHRTDIQFVNHYGPTETTIGAVAYTIGNHAIDAFQRNPVIGTPVTNNQVLILGEQQQLMAVGEPGELCIAGSGLAAGYLNRDELTREKFVTHPFNPEQRLYKTGDLARYWPDGTIAFLGRKDYQIKIKGFRIELPEIEHALKGHPSVQNAVVTVYTGSVEEPRILAYYTESVRVKPEALANYLRDLLPVYMIPAMFIPLSVFPFTPNGKIDRNALPLPASLLNGQAERYEPPGTVTEKVLATLWEKELGRKQVGIRDNYFEIGGHSLLATRLIAQIQKQLCVKISLKQIFTLQTVEKIAAVIDELKKETFTGISPAPVQQHYPVSPAQRQLWMLHKMSGGDSAFNMPVAYRFEGTCNIPVLQKAISAILERHEILRTVFVETELGPRQVVQPVAGFPANILLSDLSNVPGNYQQAINLINEEAYQPFDLAAGPLFRARLITVSPDLQIFLYNSHHIVSDAWSKEILIKEMLQLYAAFCQGAPDPLPKLKIQYKDYVMWLEQQQSQEQVDTHRRYWLNRFLEEPPVLQLPTDMPRPAIKTTRGEARDFLLQPELSAALKGLARNRGVSLFMLLMTALKTLLYRNTGQEDIIVGTPVSGREHEQLQDQVGLYLNNLAIRTVFRGNSTFTDLLDNVKENVLGAFEHQLYPFDLLLEDLQLKRDFSRSPVYDVVLVLGSTAFNNDIARPDRLPGLEARKMNTGFRTSIVDLRFVFVEQHSTISFLLEYNKDLFLPQTVEQMAAQLIQIFESVAANPAVRLTEIPLFSTPVRENNNIVQNTFSFDFK